MCDLKFQTATDCRHILWISRILKHSSNSSEFVTMINKYETTALTLNSTSWQESNIKESKKYQRISKNQISLASLGHTVLGGAHYRQSCLSVCIHSLRMYTLLKKY